MMGFNCKVSRPKTLTQIELRQNSDWYENKVYVLPKHLDEKVTRLHLAKIGAELLRIVTSNQAIKIVDIIIAIGVVILSLI